MEGRDLSGRSTDNALFSFGRSAGEDAAGDSYAFMRVGGGTGSGRVRGYIPSSPSSFAFLHFRSCFSLLTISLSLSLSLSLKGIPTLVTLASSSSLRLRLVLPLASMPLVFLLVAALVVNRPSSRPSNGLLRISVEQTVS